jgi:maltoporin
VEDLNVHFGKMAVPFLNAARADIVTENGNLAKSNIDVRLYDLKGPAGLWAGWFDFATSKGGQTSAGTRIPTADGYAFGVRYKRLEWHGGFHTFSVQYGTGAASNFSNPGNGTVIADLTPYRSKSKQLLFTEQVLFQPNDRFAIMPIFLYRWTRDGNPRHGWDQWVSFGARPEFFFTKYLSLAVEAGFDHTQSRTGQYDGWLRKFTIAPQIGAGRNFSAAQYCAHSSLTRIGRMVCVDLLAEMHSEIEPVDSPTECKRKPGGNTEDKTKWRNNNR